VDLSILEASKEGDPILTALHKLNEKVSEMSNQSFSDTKKQIYFTDPIIDSWSNDQKTNDVRKFMEKLTMLANIKEEDRFRNHWTDNYIQKAKNLSKEKKKGDKTNKNK
jgi:hypothetical protein